MLCVACVCVLVGFPLPPPHFLAVSWCHCLSSVWVTFYEQGSEQQHQQIPTETQPMQLTRQTTTHACTRMHTHAHSLKNNEGNWGAVTLHPVLSSCCPPCNAPCRASSSASDPWCQSRLTAWAPQQATTATPGTATSATKTAERGQERDKKGERQATAKGRSKTKERERERERERGREREGEKQCFLCNFTPPLLA